jgi:hypothetical protein
VPARVVRGAAAVAKEKYSGVQYGIMEQHSSGAVQQWISTAAYNTSTLIMDEFGLPVLPLRTSTHSNQRIFEEIRGVDRAHAGVNIACNICTNC